MTLSLVALTPTENALLVEETQSTYGPGLDDGTKSSSLWRLTTAGIVQRYRWKGTTYEPL